LSENPVWTLAGVAVGAVLGLLASVGLYDYQERKRKSSLRTRLIDELTHIRGKIQQRMETRVFEKEAYFTEFFEHAHSDLVETVDAKTWELVIRAYQAINSLNFTGEGLQTANHYSDVEHRIDMAVLALRQGPESLNN
jgi:predicted AlkP superfamily phosphohydrolase/phosphomutase